MSEGGIGSRRTPIASSFNEEPRENVVIRTCLVLALLMSPLAAAAETPPGPEAVVRAYTDAANRNDLDGFLALYDRGIRKYRFPGQLTSEGVEHNREVYARSFAANPRLHVEILDMIVLGDKVMVHDRVTGLANGQTSDELTVYQVQNGRITNILYVERLAGGPTR